MPFVCSVATSNDSTPMVCNIYIVPNVYSLACLHKPTSLDSLMQRKHIMIWLTACRQGANSCFVWGVYGSSIVYNLLNPVHIDWRKKYCNIATQ